MWAGRFTKQLDQGVNDFNSSIRVDCRMYKQDIGGSIAHATMLSEQGIISKEDAKQIIDGLSGILCDIESGKLEFDMTAEDIHMFVEAELTKRIGDVGKKLHTARSRNDQVALDMKLFTALSSYKIRVCARCTINNGESPVISYMIKVAMAVDHNQFALPQFLNFFLNIFSSKASIK